MIQLIVKYIIETLVNMLASFGAKKIEEKKEENKVEAANETNVQKYESAESRPDKIKAAEDLLNRTP